MMFVDGGATVAGIVSAGAAVLGYKQQRQDEVELVDQPDDLEQPSRTGKRPATP